jgi:hypothetical protein
MRIPIEQLLLRYPTVIHENDGFDLPSAQIVGQPESIGFDCRTCNTKAYIYRIALFDKEGKSSVGQEPFPHKPECIHSELSRRKPAKLIVPEK